MVVGVLCRLLDVVYLLILRSGMVLDGVNSEFGLKLRQCSELELMNGSNSDASIL